MFDIFKRKPKRCQKCSCEQQKLHTVCSTYCRDNTDETPLEVCTPCLSRIFLNSLQTFSARAIFIEPISEDGYVFVRFTDEPDKKNMAEPFESFLAPHGTTCSICSKATQYCWLPLEVTVDEEPTWREKFTRGAPLQYHDKSTFADYQYLCSEHLSAQFLECAEKNHFYFIALRLPVGDSDGFCY